MKIRNIAFLSFAFLSASAVAALAQAPAAQAPPPAGAGYNGDVAVTYEWVRSNTQPGDCGCFHLNGGGLSGSVHFHESWSAVADLSAVYAGDVPTTNASLTLVSYLGGIRYALPQVDKLHNLQPFVQGLFGGAHAGGGGAGEGDGSNAFMMRLGGGLDLPLNQRFAVRVFQADYQMATFANGSSGRQNNLLLAAGIVARWGHSH